MRNFILTLIIILDCLGFLSAQSFQDCNSAFPICEFKTYHFGSVKGFGKVLYNSKELICFDEFEETNAIWLKFQIENKGIINFDILPIDERDDFDFVLFKKNDNCNDLEAKRCMSSGRSIGELENNEFICLGKTGLRDLSSDSYEEEGCNSEDDNYLKSLKVKDDESYVLLINNFESEKGFSIEFYGDAKLKPFANCLEVTKNHLFLSKVYPNPTHDKVFVDFIVSSKETVFLSISDLGGRILERKEIQPSVGLNQFEFDLDNYQDGTYLISAQQNSTSESKKFIKQ